MANTRALIAQAYSAFNRRDIDDALAVMSENVDWPKASEGGRGHCQVNSATPPSGNEWSMKWYWPMPVDVQASADV